MIISMILFLSSAESSLPQTQLYRDEATSLIQNTYETHPEEDEDFDIQRKVKDDLQNPQICLGLAEYYFYGGSEILLNVPELTQREMLNLDRFFKAAYWYIKAAILGSKKAESIVEIHISEIFDPENINVSELTSELGKKLKENDDVQRSASETSTTAAIVEGADDTVQSSHQTSRAQQQYTEEYNDTTVPPISSESGVGTKRSRGAKQLHPTSTVLPEDEESKEPMGRRKHYPEQSTSIEEQNDVVPTITHSKKKKFLTQRQLRRSY